MKKNIFKTTIIVGSSDISSDVLEFLTTKNKLENFSTSKKFQPKNFSLKKMFCMHSSFSNSSIGKVVNNN